MLPIILILFCTTIVKSLPYAYEDINSIDLKDIQFTTSKPKDFTVLPEFPNSGRTRAVLEQESPLSQLDSTYSKAQKTVADILNPKPIVDTIKEDEKYGNYGQNFKTIGKMIVNGYEAFSNLLNALFEYPMKKVKQVGKTITKNLNAIGGKLVGL